MQTWAKGGDGERNGTAIRETWPHSALSSCDLSPLFFFTEEDISMTKFSLPKSPLECCVSPTKPLFLWIPYASSTLDVKMDDLCVCKVCLLWKKQKSSVSDNSVSQKAFYPSLIKRHWRWSSCLVSDLLPLFLLPSPHPPRHAWYFWVIQFWNCSWLLPGSYYLLIYSFLNKTLTGQSKDNMVIN